MKRRSYVALLVTAALVFASEPGWISPQSQTAEAAQATAKKSTTKKPAKKPAAKKTSYCGYPAPPNPAGMSDFCAMQYDFYCRRGVGCNQFGR